MPIETLTELHYSQDRKGPWRIYVYERNSEYHRGGVWFMKTPGHPEEGELTIAIAELTFRHAMQARREIRVCDSGDMLVFHAKNGEVLFGEKFWEEISR
jgi:hypothetical protein